MTFGMLKILAWIAIYLSILELGLEIRAYYRGFDTMLFGSYRRPTLVAKEKATPLSATLSLPSESAVEPHQREPGVIRYWIASSSQAEDVYLSHDLIFPTRLENLLRHSGIPAIVVNASHAGMDINANRIDLETRGPAWKPDVVILYQMSNTISDLSKRLLSNAPSNPGRLDKIGKEGEKPKADWTVRLIEQTAIYSQLKGLVTSRLATKRVLSDTIGERGDAEFEAMVHDFIHTSRRIGATTVLCTFATSHIRKDLPNFPDTAVTLIFRYNVYLSLEGWVNTIERFNRILRRIAREEGLMLIDLEAVLAGHEEYFRDFVHFTPKGHTIVAEVMHDTLLANSSSLNRHHFVMP